MTNVDVSVVIGANEDLILGCLESLEASSPKCEFSVHVVDNGAAADTITRLRAEFPDADIMRNGQTLGFAANHNRVIEATSGEYILILNDDTVMQGPVLEVLARFLAEHPTAGAVGCRIVNADGTLQPSTYGEPSLLKVVLHLTGLRRLLPNTAFARRLTGGWPRRLFPRQLATYWDHDRACEVDAVKGACFMVRRETVKQVGPMDEVALAYGEEIEWQMRMRRAGWKVFFVPDATVLHYGSRSFPFWPDRLAVEHVKGMLNIFRKHRSPAQLLALRALLALAFGPRAIICYTAAAFSPAFRARLEACRAIVRLALCFPP